ncbi:MAG: TlpA family protein disulfide reductase, partial [Bacteroidales bacterium]
KLVYIDFWATWCGPCRHELPFLMALEKDYHGKKVVFVSISMDDNKAAWEKMVKEQNMKGVQLYAEGAWKSFVATNYQIRGIPTFFLIDANGNILKPNAPRPSSNEIRPLLDENLAKL